MDIVGSVASNKSVKVVSVMVATFYSEQNEY